MQELWLNTPDWLIVGLLVGTGALVGLFIAVSLLRLASWLAARPDARRYTINTARLRLPLYTLLPLLCAFILLRMIWPEALDDDFFLGTTKILSVGLLTWLCVRIIQIISAALIKQYDISAKDNLRARQIRTQVMVMRRIALFLVFLISLSAIFLLFDGLHGLGVSILASAGVAGIVIGLAAQKALGNLLAGIQIALTQPIRIEDVVIVEGEWGWIEEITLTYVVVRIWDLRRLVLPISYFIEHPFQNWTRTSANILGSVELYTDYTTPVDDIRAHLDVLLTKTPLWDGAVKAAQVTDTTDRCMKIRILVSAADSSTAWDLRCYIREEMVRFLQQNHPTSLPKMRAEAMFKNEAVVP